MSIPKFNKRTISIGSIAFTVNLIIFAATHILVNTTIFLCIFIILTIAWYILILRLEEEDIKQVQKYDYDWLMHDEPLYNVLELPNCPDPSKIFNYISLLKFLEDEDFQDYLLKNTTKGNLNIIPILYGDVGGIVFDDNKTLVYSDLTQAPSLLIAGISGSGKSTLLHQIISVLLTYNKPTNLNLYLCDTKRVELNRYAKFPHTKKIIYTHEEVDAFLTGILEEINGRYRYFDQVNVPSIQDYNKLLASEQMRLPFIVVIIEELGDIMLGSEKDIQNKLIKILQKGRAAGVHVITLTQRPSAQIINSSIKANIPTRVALRVASAVDSKIIIDQNGAEGLINNKGEMWVLDGGRLKYAISTVVTPEETKKLEQAWLEIINLTEL